MVELVIQTEHPLCYESQYLDHQTFWTESQTFTPVGLDACILKPKVSGEAKGEKHHLNASGRAGNGTYPIPPSHSRNIPLTVITTIILFCLFLRQMILFVSPPSSTSVSTSPAKDSRNLPIMIHTIQYIISCKPICNRNICSSSSLIHNPLEILVKSSLIHLLTKVVLGIFF